MPGRLGRKRPTDWRHVDRYPLRVTPAAPVPVVLGINWYENFDHPQLDGRTYWIGRGDLGAIRGGHAICARPYGVTDYTEWWDFYDQGNEGACVGFSCSRMMTLLNRRRYAAGWLYRHAQEVDEWPETPPEEGTSVRAGCDILRTTGHKRASVKYPAYTREYNPDLAEGIAENRWATTWDQVRGALGVPDSQDGVTLLNSWGRYYPHYVRLTDEAGALLLEQDGEACLVTDR